MEHHEQPPDDMLDEHAQIRSEPAAMERDVSSDRLKAFSDGVFAFAITLLVLTINIPQPQALHGSLLAALLSQKPSYLAYVLSFVIVGHTWLNHYTMFSYITRSNRALAILNLLLLMNIAVLPFPTALLALYVGSGQPTNQQTAIALYSGILTIGAIFYNTVWQYALHHPRLLDANADPEAIKRLSRIYLVGPIFYGIAFLLSFVLDGIPGLALCIFLAIFFIVPGVAGRVRFSIPVPGLR